jgi:hypothetical protein
MSVAKSYFYFFSYGSNLLFERIKERLPSVEIIQPYHLFGYNLIFNKSSKDGSTKANLQKTDNLSDFVWRVVQRIDITEKSSLDRAEGLGNGYNLNSFKLEIDGQVQDIHFFIATDRKYLKEGNPYDWYLDYVVKGAIENNFPIAHIKQLLSIAATVDHSMESRNSYNKELAGNIKMHKELNPEVWKR